MSDESLPKETKNGQKVYKVAIPYQATIFINVPAFGPKDAIDQARTMVRTDVCETCSDEGVQIEYEDKARTPKAIRIDYLIRPQGAK